MVWPGDQRACGADHHQQVTTQDGQVTMEPVSSLLSAGNQLSPCVEGVLLIFLLLFGLAALSGVIGAHNDAGRRE